jgi:chromate transporter
MPDTEARTKTPPPVDSQANSQAGPSPLRLFWLFFRISAVTVGGGYAMVPVAGRALEKKGWIEEEEFYRLFARAQSFPGPLIFTTSLVVGAHLSGPYGATASALGVVLPPFGTLVAVGALLGRIGDVPLVRHFLEGAGATVPGLVAAMLWKLGAKRKWTIGRVLTAAALALALILLPSYALPVFLAAVLVTYQLEKRWKR